MRKNRFNLAGAGQIVHSPRAGADSGRLMNTRKLSGKPFSWSRWRA
jgi:hypothetical protein